MNKMSVLIITQEKPDSKGYWDDDEEKFLELLVFGGWDGMEKRA